MSSNPGGDESFVAFSFAIVSIVMIFLYLPLVTGLLRHAWSYSIAKLTGEPPKKRKYGEADEEEDKPMWVLWSQIKEVPSALLFAVRNPGVCLAGASVLVGQRSLLRKTILPRAFWFCFRPRIFMLWLWIFLLSSAAYTTLTFDAYGALGLKSGATEAQIKKAYRQLTLINHPDHNKTDEARVIYAGIRKAYKALVDKDAFEEEMKKEQQFQVGIALPSFLTNHAYDGYVLFGLLFLLFLVPYLIWRYWSGSPQQKLQQALDSLPVTSLEFEPLYQVLGIPQDPKFIERRKEKIELLSILQQVGIPLPHNADETITEDFPSPVEFKARCLAPDRYAASLMKLGFDQDGMNRLKAFFEHYEPTPRVRLEKTPFVRTNQATFDATVFLMNQLMKDMEATFEEVRRTLMIMTGAPDIQLRSTQKVLAHHKDVLDALHVVYGYKDGVWKEPAKVSPHDLNLLTEAPQKRAELVRDVTREIQGMFIAMRRRMEMEYQAQMQAAQKGGGAVRRR